MRIPAILGSLTMALAIAAIWTASGESMSVAGKLGATAFLTGAVAGVWAILRSEL